MNPGARHEERVRLLRSLAILSGYIKAASLNASCRPDVFQVNPSARAVFLGEAKHSETSGKLETRLRLAHYLDGVAAWCRFGFSARFVICASGGRRIAYTWERALLELGPRRNLSVVGLEATTISADDFVVALALFPHR
jgi:hypothetical protein